MGSYKPPRNEITKSLKKHTKYTWALDLMTERFQDCIHDNVRIVNFALSQTCAILFLIALSFVKMKYLDLLLVLSLSVVSVQNKTKQKKNAKGDRIRCYDSRCPIPGA